MVKEEQIVQEPVTMDPWVMYVVINTDLHMSVGKVGATTGHGVQFFMKSYYEAREIELPSSNTASLLHDADAWFGSDYRKILVGATTREIENKIALLELRHFSVIDAGFRDVPKGSLTGIVFWPVQKSNAPKLLKRLRLLE